jgi:hypothetical protein
MNSGLYSQLKLSQRYLARPGAAGLQAAPAGGGGGGARGRRGGVKRPFEFPSMLPLLSSPREYFFSLPFFGRCGTLPRSVW